MPRRSKVSPHITTSDQAKQKLLRVTTACELHLVAHADGPLVLLFHLLLLPQVAVEQVLLQRASATLLHQQPLRLTQILLQLPVETQGK